MMLVKQFNVKNKKKLTWIVALEWLLIEATVTGRGGTPKSLGYLCVTGGLEGMWVVKLKAKTENQMIPGVSQVSLS